jgi:UDP-glucose 4-epimerase
MCMRIVVTGATGNVGSALLPRLLSTPGVTGVVGIARRPPSLRDPRIEWHALDVADDDLRPAFDGADVVVHLAWLMQPSHRPDVMRRVNVVGTRRVAEAFVEVGAPALVHASSVGAYSPGSKDRAVDESYPTGGLSSSTYSRHKVAAERMLDELEALHPERRVVRMRKGIVLQPDAASALARYFLGPLVPQSLVRRALLPVVPHVPGLVAQVAHAADVARAYAQACTRPVQGAFNIAAEPALDAMALARLLGARPVPMPAAPLRAAVDLTWRLRLQPTDPGWVDITLRSPLMDTSRVRALLGWTPRHDPGTALVATLEAMGAGRGAATPVLRPRARGAARWREAVGTLRSGAGADDPVGSGR